MADGEAPKTDSTGNDLVAGAVILTGVAIVAKKIHDSNAAFNAVNADVQARGFDAKFPKLSQWLKTHDEQSPDYIRDSSIRKHEDGSQTVGLNTAEQKAQAEAVGAVANFARHFDQNIRIASALNHLGSTQETKLPQLTQQDAKQMLDKLDKAGVDTKSGELAPELGKLLDKTVGLKITTTQTPDGTSTSLSSWSHDKSARITLLNEGNSFGASIGFSIKSGDDHKFTEVRRALGKDGKVIETGSETPDMPNAKSATEPGKEAPKPARP